jgi:hypothetical protein
MLIVSPFIVNKNIINYNTSIIFFQTPVFLTKKIIQVKLFLKLGMFQIGTKNNSLNEN